MCFGCSKEPSHRGGSFEYPHSMFWLRNKKNNFFQLHTLIWGLSFNGTSNKVGLGDIIDKPVYRHILFL